MRAPYTVRAREHAPPHFLLDGWAWLAAASALLLPLRLGRAPLGQPCGDDLLFLRSALVTHASSWLDGGGLPAYWRPLARQAYYGVFGRTMLEHPAWIGALHVALLAVAAFALCRALRGRLSGPAACVAASFPLLAEGHRVLVAWPGHFQDVGPLVFIAFAMLAASRDRVGWAIAASAAALLCKEIAVVGVLLLPFVPFGWSKLRTRVRAVLGVGSLLVAWAALYAVAVHSYGVRFARDFVGSGASERARSLGERIGWAFSSSINDVLSAGSLNGTWARLAWAALAVLVAVAFVARFTSAAAARRAAPRSAFVVFGITWFVLATLALTQVTLPWVPSRAAFGMVGAGIALAALLDAASPLMLALLVGIRLAAFFAAPLPPPRLTPEAAGTGGREYVSQLTRMQFLARDARWALHEARPELPQGSVVVQHAFPRLVSAMFDGDVALHVWYRDTTLRWSTFDAWRDHPSAPIAAIVEYQPDRDSSMVVVEPAAMRALLAGADDLRAGRRAEARAAFAAADLLQRDRRAGVFLTTVAQARTAAAVRKR